VVLKAVHRSISDLAPGELILARGHNLQLDIPAENIVVMYKEVRLSGYTRAIQDS
jgi:hypothetical protein